MRLVTASEMQSMDLRTIEELGIPGRVLMENAGLGASKLCVDYFKPQVKTRFSVVAGSGNNGGDGFVIARYLASWGYDVHVFLMAKREKVKGDALSNLELLSSLSVPVTSVTDIPSFQKAEHLLVQTDIWVDALLGTGLSSQVRGFFHHVISHMNDTYKPVMSVDISSGLNSDTGHPNGIAVSASMTVTFGFAKTGHVVYPGVNYTGKLEVVEIGIPPIISERVKPLKYYVTEKMIAPLFKSRETNAHKGTNGHMIALGGSPGKMGAISMTCVSAMRTGAGLVTCGIPENQMNILGNQVVECMSLALPQTKNGGLSDKALPALKQALMGKSCVAIGPGMGTERQTGVFLNHLLGECSVPMVIDADALNLMSKNTDLLKKRNAPLVLTPHPKEMARLMGTSVDVVQKDRVACCQEFSARYDVIVVLKGAGTVIACPDGRLFVNGTGNPGMASGGMGDVLTGIIAGLISQGFEPENAAVAGVYVHGAAADYLRDSVCIHGFVATDVIHAIPKILDRLIKNKPERYES